MFANTLKQAMIDYNAKCSPKNLRLIEELADFWSIDKIDEIVNTIKVARLSGQSQDLVLEVETGEPPYPYTTDLIIRID